MKKPFSSFCDKALVLSLLFLRPSMFTLACASILIAGKFMATIH